MKYGERPPRTSLLSPRRLISACRSVPMEVTAPRNTWNTVSVSCMNNESSGSVALLGHTERSTHALVQREARAEPLVVHLSQLRERHAALHVLVRLQHFLIESEILAANISSVSKALTSVMMSISSRRAHRLWLSSLAASIDRRLWPLRKSGSFSSAAYSSSCSVVVTKRFA